MLQQTWFPFKIIDLQEVLSVNAVKLCNMEKIDATHAYIFSILLSDNAQDWICYYSQGNHSWQPSNNNHINFEKTINARYIKFQLNTFGNIDPLEIIPQQAPSDISTLEQDNITETIQTYKNISDKSCVVFSTLFNESDDFLLLYLNNFLFFTPENTYLIVNLPPSRAIPNAAKELSKRVILVNGTVKRKKWGNTLLLGHLENLKYANTHLTFDYFCTTASNSLFVRQFDLKNILCQLHQKSIVPVVTQRPYDNDVQIDIDQENHKGGWMWHHYMLSPDIKTLIQNDMKLDQLSVTQIEGLFASKNDWLIVLQYYSNIEQMTPYLSDKLFMALEELLPASIFNKYASGYFVHTCYMLWKHPQRTVKTSEIISIGSNLPQHISSIKWFQRSRNSAATLAVSTEWGRKLLGIEKFSLVSTSLDAFLVVQQFAEASQLTITNRPITSNWFNNQNNESPTALFWASTSFKTEKQYIEVPPHNYSPKKIFFNPAHLIFSNTNSYVDLTCYLTDNKSSNCLYYSCWAKDQNNNLLNIDTPTIEGYLYLSSCIIEKSIKISICKNEITHYKTHQLLYETFFSYDNNKYNDHHPHNYYKLIPSFINETHDTKELYFNNCMWIGIPIISSNTLKINISLI